MDDKLKNDILKRYQQIKSMNPPSDEMSKLDQAQAFMGIDDTTPPNRVADRMQFADDIGAVNLASPIYDNIRKRIERNRSVNKTKDLLNRYQRPPSINPSSITDQFMPDLPSGPPEEVGTIDGVPHDQYGRSLGGPTPKARPEIDQFLPDELTKDYVQRDEFVTDPDKIAADAQMDMSETFEPASTEDPFAIPEDVEMPQADEVTPKAEEKVAKEVETLKTDMDEAAKAVTITPEEVAGTNLELEEALQAKRDAQRRAMLMKAAGQLSAALIGGTTAVLDTKASDEFAQMIEEYGKTPLEDYLTKQKDLDARQLRADNNFKRAIELTKFQRQEEQRIREEDPNSQESELARTLAKKLMPNRSFEGSSASQLTSMLPMMKDIYATEAAALAKQQSAEMAQLRLDIQKGHLDLREKQIEQSALNRELQAENKALQREDKQSKELTDRVLKHKKDFRNDYRIKELEKQGVSFDQVDKLMQQVESGNQTAWGSVGTKMARAMGEVGVLTDADVVRYTQGGSVAKRLGDKWRMFMSGRPMEFTNTEIRSIVKAMKEVAPQKISAIADDYVNDLVQNYDLEPDEVRRRLGVDVFMGSTTGSEGRAPTSGGMTKILDPNGVPRLIPNDMVEAALAAGGKRIK